MVERVEGVDSMWVEMMRGGRSGMIGVVQFWEIGGLGVIEGRKAVDIVEEVESWGKGNVVVDRVVGVCERCVKEEIMVCSDGVGNSWGVVE